jgi:F0F1-type ATP synthase assembly protein I
MLLNRTLVSVLAQAGCLTVIIGIGGLLIGIWLDKIFGTKPILTALAFAGSAPIAMAAIYWRVKAATAHLKPNSSSQTSSGPKADSTEEEPTSDR